MPSFLDLPIELHLEIFYALPTTNDALRLARTCSQLHGLFSNRKTKINILRFAAGVPGKFSYGRECALAGTNLFPLVLEDTVRLNNIQTLREFHPRDGG